MPLHIDPKKSRDRTLLKGLTGSRSENAPTALSAGPGRAKRAKAEPEATMRRAKPTGMGATEAPVQSCTPGTLAWAERENWHMETNGSNLVRAWKSTGERTAWYPAGPEGNEATHYRAALDAAVEMEQS